MTAPRNRRPATEAEARALASALRLRILRLCLDRALTNRELARLLGANPATMLHHVRTLLETGFLEAQPVRRGPRGSREVPYRATGKSWNLSVHDGPSPSRALVDAFLQEIEGVDLDRTYQVRLGLRLTETEHTSLIERLNDVIQEYAARPLSSEGRAYALYLNLHEDPTRDAPA